MFIGLFNCGVKNKYWINQFVLIFKVIVVILRK